MNRIIYFIFCLFFLKSFYANADVWKPTPGHTPIAIWPTQIPDAVPTQGPEEMTLRTEHLIAGKPWHAVEKVSEPTITVYQPRKNKSGAAVVVFPGGGYWVLAIDLEGTEVCDWLTSRGITCILLKYRVPGDGFSPRSGCYPNSPMALEDAQRTMSLVRFHAPEWGIDPKKIGVLGFSAGGHLVAAISTHFNQRRYSPIDNADKENMRPDFAVALYSGHMMENTSKEFELNSYIPVTKDTPPTFLLHAEDDPVDDVKNSLVYYIALKNAGVPTEMHLYAEGKHAFGLRRTNFPITEWPHLVEKWLKTIGMFKK